jgi:hypothetical protein
MRAYTGPAIAALRVEVLAIRRVTGLTTLTQFSNQEKRKFRPAKTPIQEKLRILLNRVIQRVVCMLEREGLLIPDLEKPWLNLNFHEPMNSFNAASTESLDRRCRIATRRSDRDAQSPMQFSPMDFLSKRAAFVAGCSLKS